MGRRSRSPESGSPHLREIGEPVAVLSDDPFGDVIRRVSGGSEPAVLDHGVDIKGSQYPTY